MLVVGGGPAGIAAAASSARNGARTLLIERYGFLGGMLTAGMVNSINGFRNQRGPTNQAVGGIAQEFVESVARAGGAFLPEGLIPYCVVVDPEIAKQVSLQLVQESGTSLLLHTLATNPLKEAGAVSGIIVHNKSGRRALRAKVVVDCTGDGDMAANAGTAYQIGRKGDGKALPMQLLFRMGSVDATRFAYYVFDNKKDLESIYDIEPLETVKEASKVGRPFGVTGLTIEYGGRPRNISCLLWKDKAVLSATRPLELYGTVAEDLSAAEVQTRMEMPQLVTKIKKIPGFEDSGLEQTAVQIGVRETRRITGEYVLTAKDVTEGSRFEDSIAIGVNPMTPLEKSQILDHDGYEIPYRCLLPEGVDGILLAGRCISTTHEAHGSTRMMATCMAIGQAAGTAAALSIETGEIPRHISIPRLQERLRTQGALVSRMD